MKALPPPRGRSFEPTRWRLEAGPPIRGIVLAALLAGGLGLGGFGVWAAAAPLASGAIAPGMVAVESNRKPVQHLEGGIVREILVKEGDRVSAGQALARLAALSVDADLEVLETQLYATLAEEARLQAERTGAGTIEFPPQLLAMRERPNVARLISTQSELFATQAAQLDSQITVHAKRIAQLKAQIESATKQIAALDRQRRLLEEETRDARELFAKGYERKSRVLALERSLEAMNATQSDLEGQVASDRQAIAETEAQSESLRRQRANEIASELDKARARRAELEEEIRKLSDQRERSVVLAPQAGMVLGLRYFAPGQVLPPGGVLMEIVPEDEPLAIDARVNPLDIDVVRPGLPAQLRFIAYKQRITPTLSGRVTNVSADVLADQKSGTPFYLARIEVDPAELAQLAEVALYPGMPVEAIIITGERTMLDYLLRPLLDSFARAFREQ